MSTATVTNPNVGNRIGTQPLSDPMKASIKLPRYAIAALVALVVTALLVGFLPRISERKVAAADTNQLAMPTVSVVSAIQGAPSVGLILPAEVRPWQEA